MPKQRYTRQLIQFSSYSIAVVLPKKVMTEFGWEAGETVDLRVDPKERQLTLARHESVRETTDQRDRVTRFPEEAATSSRDPRPADQPEDLTPIPEII